MEKDPFAELGFVPQDQFSQLGFQSSTIKTPPPIDISLGEKVGSFLAPTTTQVIKKWSKGEKITGREALGSALEVGSFLIPAGAVGRGVGLAAKGAGLAARRLGARALQAGAVGAISGGMAGAGREVGAGGSARDIAGATLGGAAFGGIVGGALPVAGAVPGAISKGAKAVAEKAVPKLLSYTSDVPEKAFETMLQRREPVVSAIKAGATPQTALKKTQEAVRGLRKTLTNDWQEGITAIQQEFTDKRMGLSDKSTESLLKIADEFGFDDKLPQNLKNASVNEWMDTLKAINELPRGILTMSPKGAKVRALQDELRKSVINTFGGDKGSVAQLYKNYSAKKGIFDAANDIVSSYSTGKPIRQSTALNRLQTLFNENKPAYLEAILDLEKATGRDILSEITASKFSAKLPTMGTPVSATTGLLSPAGALDKAIKLLMLPLSSPRSAGFIARTLSQVKSPGMPKGISPGGRVLPTIQKGASNINKTMAGKGGLSIQDVSKDLATEARKYKTAEEFVKGISKKEFRYDFYLEGNATIGELPISRFESDIKPSQIDVDKIGVNKWKKRIESGERPKVLVEYSGRFNEPRVVDGHTRLVAYKELGIKNIPVIDRTNKILKSSSQLTDIWNKAHKK